MPRLAATRAWRCAIAVNLSMRNLLDLEFPERRAARCSRRGRSSPALLEFEITESTMLADPVRTKLILEKLSAMGIRLAIDDFGTGYSSLAYLKRLPIDEIKIDRSFVMHMSDDRGRRDDRPLDDRPRRATSASRSSPRASRRRRRWDELNSLGCTVAQGYFLSRPRSRRRAPRLAARAVRTAPSPRSARPDLDLDRQELRRAPRARRSGRRPRASSSCVPRSTIAAVGRGRGSGRRRGRSTGGARSRSSCGPRRAGRAPPAPRARSRVERARRLVEHEHGRVAQDRARDRDALLLAAREAVAALADDGVVAVRRGTRSGRGCAPRAPPPRSPRRSRRAARSAGSRASVRVEEVRLLRDDADVRRERREGHVAHVDAVDRARARARRRRGARRGSRASSCRAPVSPTIAVRVPAGTVERRRPRASTAPSGVVAEPDVARSATSPRHPRGELDRVGPLVDLDRQVEVLEDAVEERERRLHVEPDARAASRSGRRGASAAW